MVQARKSAFRSPRQEDNHQFEASLGLHSEFQSQASLSYSGRPVSKKKEERKKLMRD